MHGGSGRRPSVRRSVGRWPGGYLPNEDCDIVVVGLGGTLGACPVFDINDPTRDPTDYVTLPNGSQHYQSDCPAGARVTLGKTIGWHSNGLAQGSSRNGLPYTDHGAGGSWQLCF
eukprot:SAG31_NODE_3420_length_4297_cov_4.123294_2_plen_115_part_00